jgi:hypothetical protein
MASLDYIHDPLDTDEDALQQDAFDYIATRWPDWTPRDGNLEAWLIGACCQIVAQAMDVGADVPPAIFRFFGQVVLGIPPIDPTPSIVSATITLVDNPDGRTIETGNLVGIEDPDGDMVPFEVVNPVTIAATVLTTAAGGVLLRSIDDGAETANLGGVGYVATDLEAFSWISAITLTGSTSGGQDGEEDPDYLNRISARLTLFDAPPVRPEHYELLARDIALRNGVRIRALAIDGLNPTTHTTNNERMVAVVVIDADTNADVSGPVKSAIDTELQGAREVTFVVNVIDPNRTAVDITFVGVARAGYDPVQVHDDAIAALESWITAWGTVTETQEWVNTIVVRHQDVSTVLNNVAGFSHWTTLTIGLGGGAQTAADHTITGDAPLATVGTLSGTVT